jgi:fibronectin type 3 domain-containing protein
MYLKLKNTLSTLVLLLVVFTSGNTTAYAAKQTGNGPEIPLAPGLTWNNLGPSTRNIALNIKGDSISLSGETYQATHQFADTVPQAVLDYYSNTQLFKLGWVSDNIFEGPDGLHQIFYHESGMYLAVEFLKCPGNVNSTCITVWKSAKKDTASLIPADPNKSVGPAAAAAFSKTAPKDEATDVSASSVVLSWGAFSPTPDKYSYCIKEGSECESNDPDWTGTYTETSVTLTNLSVGKTYYWQVRAVTCVSCTPKTYVYANNEIWWKFTTVSSSTLTPPVVTASDGTDSAKVAVSWTASSGATSYKVYRSDTQSGAKFPADGFSTTNLSGDDVWGTPGVTYYYWVKACNTTTCGDFSTAETGWRKIATPAVTASDGAFQDKVEVSWTALSGATSYLVYRSETFSGTKTPANGFSTTSLSGVDTWATPGVTYYYWVRACTATGCGDFSAAETGWRRLSSPTVTASDGTFQDKVEVGWTAPSGATSYVVYRSETLSGAKIPPDGFVITGLSGVDIWATPGVTYYYWVKACNGANCGDFGVAQGRRKP